MIRDTIILAGVCVLTASGGALESQGRPVSARAVETQRNAAPLFRIMPLRWVRDSGRVGYDSTDIEMGAWRAVVAGLSEMLHGHISVNPPIRVVIQDCVTEDEWRRLLDDALDARVPVPVS